LGRGSYAGESSNAAANAPPRVAEGASKAAGRGSVELAAEVLVQHLLEHALLRCRPGEQRHRRPEFWASTGSRTAAASVLVQGCRGDGISPPLSQMAKRKRLSQDREEVSHDGFGVPACLRDKHGGRKMA
jgi:hypothetical protein